MKNIIQVKKELCVGCGVCAGSCPKHAIFIVNGQARVNQRMCNQCGLCIGVCPRGAIVGIEPVSDEKLAAMIGSLKKQADSLINRIERLR